MTMAVLAGGVVNEARNHGKWDKPVLAYLGSELVNLIDHCELADACQDRGNALAEVLGQLMSEPETVDPQQVAEQANGMGQELANLAACIFDVYALTADFNLNFDRDVDDWPDEDWLMTIRPLRVRSVR
jgi:hypothetical protein|tara:strand:- start:241 stop:627 length:387 start_codon:yes stop_codon:yes gene_type:complete